VAFVFNLYNYGSYIRARGAPDIISGRISGPDSEIIELSGIRPDISNIRPRIPDIFSRRIKFEK
jgi:hypothetical protein